MDPYNFLESVDISNQIPSSFYTQIESKKWSERKEALEIIEKITAVPRIKNADFNELVRVLKKTIAKDANVVVVQSAAKCLHQLAQGLRYDFAPHSNSSLSTIFEKFKEKKPHVIAVLRDAADAAFIGTNLENIFEDVIQLLDNKNPQVKSEMCLFLARMFARYPAQVMNKKTLRPLVNALIKTLSDMDATVRDNSAMAIGTAMKVSGEKLMMTLIADVEPIKLPKIKEFCEKAQVRKVPKAALSAMNNNNPAPQAPQTNHPPPRNSSATMVRSTSNRRLTVAGSKPPTQRPQPTSAVPSSNATVKRNATIIKRSTAPRRSVAPASSQHNLQQQQQQQQQQPQPQLQQQQPFTPIANPMGPPSVPQNANNNMAMRNNHLNHSSSLMGLVSTPAKPVFTTMLHGPSKFQKNGILDSLIFKLISDDTNDVLNALTELEEILADDTDSDFKTRVNQLIDLNSLQLVKSFDCLRLSHTVDESASQRIQKISNLIRKVFSRPQLISAASKQSIRFLLLQLFTLTQACGNITDDGFVRRTLNNLAVAVMDSFEPANIMCILTGLLNEPTPLSIVEPVKDAIIRSMRSFK